MRKLLAIADMLEGKETNAFDMLFLLSPLYVLHLYEYYACVRQFFVI